MCLWQKIAELAPSQAAVLGSGLGFISLAFAAILNSYLNRRRDRSLHKFDQLNLLRAIVIEVTEISNLLRHQIKKIEGFNHRPALLSMINPLSLTTIYTSNSSKLHILPPNTLYQIIPFYAALYEHEYNAATHGAELIGGKEDKFKTFNINGTHCDVIIELNRALDAKCQVVLSVCFPLVQGHNS